MLAARSLLCSSFTAAASLAYAQVPVFVALPVGARVTDVANPGQPVAVGTYNGRAFRWTLSSGLVDLGPVAGNSDVLLSADASAIFADTAGADTVVRCSRWTGGTTWTQISGIGAASNGVETVTGGVSDDGTVVVGRGWIDASTTHAFAWNALTGTLDAGANVAGASSGARDVSSDGRVLVGWQDNPSGARFGARWAQGIETIFTYTTPSGSSFPVGEAQGVDASGTFAVGRSLFAHDNSGWVWDAVTDAVTPLPNLAGAPASNRASPVAITDDGTIVGGDDGGSLATSRAVLWTNGAPEDYLVRLATAGVSMPNGYATLGTITAISGDGQVVGGWVDVVTGGTCGGWITYMPVAGTAFCFGDGEFADHTSACPCGNNGAFGRGCAHSFDARGAKLDASGAAQDDDVVLTASELPSSSFTLFLQHAAPGDTVFYDGILCAGGALVRLRGHAASAGRVSFPDGTFPRDTTITLAQRGGVVPGQGALRSYAAWYRNAATTFCPPAAANVTNGVRVSW